MTDNYTLDGGNYTQEQVLAAAKNKGLTIDAYINEYYPDDFKDNMQAMDSNVFTGANWGTPTKFVNTGIQQDEGRGTFKAEQTSTFEGAPGTNTFPKIKQHIYDESTNEQKIGFYNSTLNNDGWNFEEYSAMGAKGITATTPRGQEVTFMTDIPEGGLVKGQVSTQEDLAKFIDDNQLSKKENRELDARRFRVQTELNRQFDNEFEKIVDVEKRSGLFGLVGPKYSPYGGVKGSLTSSIAALQEQNPALLDDIRNNIMKNIDSENLTDYQIEDLFINVINSKKNKQLLDSDDLLKTVYNDYKKGEYDYSYEDMVELDTKRNLNNLTTDQKKLYSKLQNFRNTTIKKINELEEHPEFDETSEDYKSLLKQKEDQESILSEEYKKVYGEEFGFYVDFNSSAQVDQDFVDEGNLEFEKYDLTEDVKSYKALIEENAQADDDETFEEKLTKNYEQDAVESSHFYSHVKNQTVDFKWNQQAMVGLYGDNFDYAFFKDKLKNRFDIDHEGQYKPIKDVPLQTVLDNWGFFKDFVDSAVQLDGEKEVDWNHLGQKIEGDKVGDYVRATKDMSIDLLARGRAWTELHLLNVDPTSYKRKKGDLFEEGFVGGLPWTDRIWQADFQETRVKNRIERLDKGQTNDQKIEGFRKLINNLNEEIVRKGEEPIKLSKKQVQNFEMTRSETFAQQAGGFTPLVGEFIAVNALTGGTMSLLGATKYLDKIRKITYLTKGGKEISGASVAAYSARTGKTVEQTLKKWNLVQNTGKVWQKGAVITLYAGLEELKMQSLDPLFGTDMPDGSGVGFYLGGTAARWAMPFKIGSPTNLAWQRFGRVVNPFSEKIVKGGIGGAVAAEVALPVEQLIAGHKSWKRWVEETYPDMGTVEKRFTGNLALFSAFGFQHWNRADMAFTVGRGKYYQKKWSKQAMAFDGIKDKGGEINGKKYTKEEANAEYQKYLELSGKAGQYVMMSEKAPEYQNPIEQKKMIEAQFDHLNKQGAKFRYYVTTNGKNHDARKKNEKGVFEKQPDAYWKLGKDGVSEFYIDARKVNDGQIPHEVWHHITNNYLAKGKTNEQVRRDNAAFTGRIQNYIQKAVSEKTKGDLDFMDFMEKNYGVDSGWKMDISGEVPANLIELMMSKYGYDMFVSNNLIGDIAFEYKKLAEKLFTGSDGKVRGGFAGKWLQPKLDLSDPKTVVDYLARLSSGIKGKEWNPNVINRLKTIFDGIRIGKDGKLYKTEKDGSETIVSANSANIAEQLRLKSALKPIIEKYKDSLKKENKRLDKGEITQAEFDKAAEKHKTDYLNESKALSKALIDIRDADETKATEKPEYKRTIDETHSEGKARINKNFYNHQNIIVPPEGVKLKPSDQKLNREYIFDIVESFKGRIIAAGKSGFDTPTYENMSEREKAETVFANTRPELIKHIERFKEETAVKLDDKTGEITGEKGKEYYDFEGYINTYVRFKEGTARKKATKKFFGEDITGKDFIDKSILEETKFDIEEQMVLKDVLEGLKPESTYPQSNIQVQKIKETVLKGKNIEVWKRFLRRHPDIALEKASDIESLTYKTIEDAVPEITKNLFSSKQAIDAVQNTIKQRIEAAETKVKSGEMTKERFEEFKKENKKTRREIEAMLTAKYTVDNATTLKKILPKNTSEITGMWTGLETVLMTRKAGGNTIDVFYTTQKASTKEGVKRVSTELTSKIFDTTGLKISGNTAGNRPQQLLKMTNEQFLNKLGIKLGLGGEINVKEMLADRNIMTTLFPALKNQLGKAITNQITRDLAGEMKEGADIKLVNNISRIITKIQSGKSDYLAARGIGKLLEPATIELLQMAGETFKSIVKNNPELDAETRVSMFHGIDPRFVKIFPKKELLKDIREIDLSDWNAIMKVTQEAGKSARVFEIIAKDEKSISILKNIFEIFDSYGGVTGRTVNESAKEVAKELGYEMSKLNIDKPLSERIADPKSAAEYNELQELIVEAMDPILLNLKNVSQGVRYVLGEGDLQLGTNEMTVDSKGKPVRARWAAAQGIELILRMKAGGEGSWAEFLKNNPKYEKVKIEALKNNDNAVVMEKHHKLLGQDRYAEINNPGPKGDKLKMEYAKEFRETVLAQEGFTYKETMLANDAMLEYFVGRINKVYDNLVKGVGTLNGKSRKEFALNTIQMFYQTQASLGKGFIRGLASHNAVTTQRAIDLPVKIVKGVKIGEDEFRGTEKEVVAEGYRSEHEFQAANFGGNMFINHIRNHSSTKNFKVLYDPIARSFKQTIIPKYVQKIIDKDGNTTSFLQRPGTSLDMTSKTNFLIDRLIAETTVDLNSGKTYDNILTNRVTDLQIYKNLKRISANTRILPSKGISKHVMLNNMRTYDKALAEGRKKNKKKRGMSTFDFDHTVGISDNYVIAKKGKKTKKIASNEWPFVGDKLLAEGWKMDFTDFNKVTDGKPGPLMQKMKNQIKKFGPDNVFILTARAPESTQAIHEYLKSEGVNIPIKNITGLGNSTGEAKALWMLKKFAEGYNDMYFVDDALPNVKAVKEVLDQLDIKSKVQLALASANIGEKMNSIMEHSLGIESKKRFSKAEGKVRGKDKKRRKLFVPDSAADLELLIEPLYGKGKEGVKNKKWFESNFLKPWERGVNDLNTARQTILNDYMSLRKNNKDVVKSLDKNVEGTNFTNDMAARVYIWNKAGFEVPGLTKTSKAKLLEHVTNNPKLRDFAENVAILTKIETGLKQPKETWWAETLASEVSETGRTVNRDKYIGDWIQRKNEIFSEQNLNKMEAELGPKWRESIENMLDRMETGKTRQRNLGRIGNSIMNYLNGSVGAIMNLNTRSATLQLISTVNFINHAENNPLAAAKAFANQPRYWKDFMKIMNSDMLRQRRDGLKINVTEAELAAAAEGGGNKAKKALAWILKQGYIPTKIADSFAISAGGATYYRNRIKMYEKQGLKTKEAEKKAWLDFQAMAERTQQSSRPDLLSQQQVSFEGRLILPFANTPMQMNRIMMKEMLDLSKGRYKGSFGENSFTNKMSKIAYYGFIQSAIFAGLQSGLFALMANSDDKEQIAQKKTRAYNTVADSFLRGMGIPGAVLAGVKNGVFKFLEQNEKGFKADYSEVGEALLNISPTIGSKFSKLDAAGNTYAYNKKEILEKGLSLDNTKGMEAVATTIEAVTNVPIARVIRKTENIQGALDDQNEAWQRLLMTLGWSEWDVGATDYQKKKEKSNTNKKDFTRKTFGKKTFKRKTFN